MTEKYKNFISNKWVDPVTEKYFESTSPAKNDEILGLFASSNAQDAKHSLSDFKLGDHVSGEKRKLSKLDGKVVVIEWWGTR